MVTSDFLTSANIFIYTHYKIWQVNNNTSTPYKNTSHSVAKSKLILAENWEKLGVFFNKTRGLKSIMKIICISRQAR